MSAPTCIWPIEARLGEGPMWDVREQCLWFVDIGGGKLHRFDPASGDRRSFDLGGQPSFAVPAEGGGLVIGNGDRLIHWTDGDAREIATIAMLDHHRTNDATVDGDGRLWFGTMDNLDRGPTGQLYCFDGRELTEHGGEATVTNGPAVNDQWLYFVDSGGRKIWRYPRDGGSLGPRILFVEIAEGDGFPDGVTLDAEDHLWVALWDGWAVRRYAPDGTLVEQVAMPCARVTKLTFGGPDLATAFVTTARIGLKQDALAEQPLAGGLFAFDPGVAGRPLPAVRRT